MDFFIFFSIIDRINDFYELVLSKTRFQNEFVSGTQIMK